MKAKSNTASNSENTAKACIAAAKKLSREASKIDFSDVVPWVYNPLQYAWKAHQQYIERYARSTCRVVFLGMNPGPWGMAQTGIPFGEIPAVRDWLGIDANISKPNPEHPKRPIDGLACNRSEVSGRRLWGLFSEAFESADAFFQSHFVTNYCPLVFMEESARNVTPDKLPKATLNILSAVCDAHLSSMLEALAPEWVVGVGAYAEACAQRVVESLDSNNIQLGRILHPSPASPAANRDWAGTATKQLKELGLWA